MAYEIVKCRVIYVITFYEVYSSIRRIDYASYYEYESKEEANEFLQKEGFVYIDNRWKKPYYEASVERILKEIKEDENVR